MKKVIRDGKVAVLISRGWGAGWYTWHGIEELLYDPEVVRMIENPDDEEDRDTIVAYCEEQYGKDSYYNGVDDLTIVWVPQGRRFIVEEYDGAESLKLESDVKWLTA